MTDIILSELIQNQIQDIDFDNKLLYNDIKRLRNYIGTSIFGDECSIWKGYSSIKNNHKHIDFYLNKKKKILFRLLYINYKHKLNDNEYIRNICSNNGNCCNINHLTITNTKKYIK